MDRWQIGFVDDGGSTSLIPWMETGETEIGKGE